MRSQSLEKRGSRPFLFVFLFLASFSASVIGIRWLAPEPHIWFFSERLSTFDSNKDDYDLLFVGSSHYRSGIVPLLFDQLMAQAGRPTRSFNFSMPGSSLPEIAYVISRVRALKPANLKWVVIEPWMKERLDENNLGKKRLIYYHDLPATLVALKCVYHLPEPEKGRLVHYQRHIQHCAYRQTNQGLALSLIGDHYQGNTLSRRTVLKNVDFNQGYYPRNGNSFEQGERKRYKAEVRDYPPRYRQSPLKPKLARLLAALLREIEAMGARPVFLFAPSATTPNRLIMPDDAPASDVIRLDDVERYSELFALENRWDSGHTNDKGARLTTAAVAEAFLQITARRGPPGAD